MTTTTVHVKTSLSRNFILSIVFAFLRMKQEVERDGVRDVPVDGEGDCRCLDSRKDPGSKSFFKALFFLGKVANINIRVAYHLCGETKNSIPLESFIKY